MENFEAEIRHKVDRLVSDYEGEKAISFKQGDFESGFAQDIRQEVEPAKEHQAEIEWLKEIMTASIVAFKHNELVKFKNLQEEIDRYCGVTESYSLYMHYEGLLEDIYGEPFDQIKIE